MITYLLKPGELTLKGENRREFEHILKRNIKTMLKAVNMLLVFRPGRIFLSCEEESHVQVESILNHVFGISGWAQVQSCEKTLEAMCHAAVMEGHRILAQGLRSFKIEARRTDKSFPVNSYGICCKCGDAVQDTVPGLTINVQKPDAVINIEVRESVFVYGKSVRGLRGLPVGTAGRGLLLLSGGIDSPVAGFMMAGRGMGIDAVHFHSYPYTSVESRQKVIDLAHIVGRYTLGMHVWLVNFAAIQQRIKEKAPLEWNTILLRMAMMHCAEQIALKRGLKCLITGESLSQVASQTVENITCTESTLKMPIFRPLIGMDKESISALAVRIGTYPISILPYPDCCVLFSPQHPVLRGNVTVATNYYEMLDLEEMIKNAIYQSSIEKCGFYD